jgi:hypothetical protein
LLLLRSLLLELSLLLEPHLALIPLDHDLVAYAVVGHGLGLATACGAAETHYGRASPQNGRTHRARYESGLVGATLVRDGHVADGIEGAVDNIENRPTVAGGTIE